MRNPEKQRARQEKREELRELLPVDLQLEFVQERPEREKWFLGGQLLKRRHSVAKEDELFFEAIKAIKKEDVEEIEKIKEEAGKERRKVADNLNEYLDLKQVIERCFEEGLPASAGKIALALAEKDPGLAKKAMERCFKEGLPASTGEIAAALGDTESAKKAMERCFEERRPASAGEIALALGDIELAKKAMERCFEEGLPASAGEIALALGDTESAKKAMERCFEERLPASAGKIALALAEKDPGLAKKAMERCFKEGRPASAGEIAAALGDIELAKKAMERCFEEGLPASASKIAVALAEKDPGLAKKAMERCFKEGVLYFAAKIAVALAEKDPGLAKKAMERCFKEGRPDSAGEIAAALAEKDPGSAKKAMERCFEEGLPASAGDIAAALAKQFELHPKTKSLVEIIQRTEVNDYGLKVVAGLLEENHDLGKFKKEYLPKYLSVKKLAEEINSTIEETKRWQNPQEFFAKHNLEIAKLHLIDPNLSTQLLRNHLSRGLSFTESYLNVFKPALNDKEISRTIKEYSKANKNLDGYNLSDLLEIASTYKNLEQTDLFVNIINSKPESFEELKSELNKNLLKKISQSLGIKAEIPEQEISQWKLKYLANLVTNQEMIKREGGEDALEVYNAILKSVLENRFQEFISNLNQEDEIGREIANHNQKAEKDFRTYNINWDNWLNFKEEVLMVIGTAKKQDRQALFDQFEQRFRQWQDSVTESSLGQSLEKDLAKLKQQKKEFDPSKINLNDPEWQAQLLPTYTKSLNYLRAKNPDFKLPVQTEESFGHLIEAISSLTQEQQKEQTAQREFAVKLWDRDPRKDMFQGNFTHCCIAVGVKETPPGGGLTTLHPETIFQYLIDKSINVAEVIDPDNNEPVAQTWLFVTLDENQEPVLVADNFEINSRYPSGNNVNRGLRESMFQFLNKYAKACGIEKVVLGRVGTNDVETSDLTSMSLPSIKKLGEYFQQEPYYLETLNSTEVWDIKRGIKEITEKKYDIHLIEEITDDELRQILEVEKVVFSPGMQSDLEDLRETLENKKGIQIIAKDEKEKIISYLSSKPLADAWEQLKNYDPELKKEEGALYIESIATVPKARNFGLFLKILQSLEEEAPKRGFKKLVFHARVETGLSAFLQKRGAKKIRTIEKWHGFGEPFDYLEIEA